VISVAGYMHTRKNHHLQRCCEVNSNTEFDILKMIAILRAFPSLQKLYLEVRDVWCNYPQKDPFLWFESNAEFTFRGSVQIRNLRRRGRRGRRGEEGEEHIFVKELH
jgi:hypothetical protein